jgi:hypothetical protein
MKKYMANTIVILIIQLNQRALAGFSPMFPIARGFSHGVEDNLAN